MASEQENKISFIPLTRSLDYTVEAALMLQKLQATLSASFHLQYLDIPLSAVFIEDIIKAEKMAIASKYMKEEDNFVGQMLMQQPVTFGRRSRDNNRKDMNPIQMIKAESCRRSRLNGKIKKAATYHRHKFITSKLRNSAAMLKCTHDVIGLAEFKLVQAGFDPNYFTQLRIALGMNRNIDDLLEISEKLH